MFSKLLLQILFFLIGIIPRTGFIRAQSQAFLTQDDYGLFHLNFSQPNLPAQSLSHYFHPELHDNIVNTWTMRDKIMEIGKKPLEDIINRALAQEIALANTHYVFYHGCKLGLLLYQDILKILTEHYYNTTLHESFLLRIPTKDYDAYKTATDFLEASNYTINDSFGVDRHYLLSVNPSLFGNSIHRETSSAFCYFLTSKSAFGINSFHLIYDAFTYYNRQFHYFLLLHHLHVLSGLLSSHEQSKTGLLMQIFIPKKIVDNITYRSKPRGVPYYSRLCGCKPSQELEAYQQGRFSLFEQPGKKIDEMQFRILLNNTYMLNTKEQGIKIFRYYNRTPNVIMYEKKIKELNTFIF